MSETIIAYLRKKGEAATAVEIASAALNMEKAPPEAANRLISALLKDDLRVQKMGEDCWRYQGKPAAEPELNECSFILCKMLPTRVSTWRDWAAIAIVQVTVSGPERLFVRERQNVRFWRGLESLIGKLSKQNKILIFDGFGNQVSLFRQLARELCCVEVDAPLFTIKSIAGHLFDQRPQTEAELSQLLGSRWLEDASIDKAIEQMESQFHLCLDLLASRKVNTVSSLQEFIQWDKEPIDYTAFSFDADFINRLPANPGVYIMRDRKGQVIYVGKAKNLFQRLRSYFLPASELDEKLTAIRRDLFQIQIHITGSELEALLLEQELIRTLNPPINRQMEVGARSHRQKSRYQRILVLPAAEENRILVVFLHPQRGLHLFSLKVEKTIPRTDPETSIIDLVPNWSGDVYFDIKKPKQIGEKIAQFYFKAHDEMIDGDSINSAEIAYSWLSANEDAVNSIDVRKITSAADCVHLLLAHAKQMMISSEKVIVR